MEQSSSKVVIFNATCMKTYNFRDEILLKKKATVFFLVIFVQVSFDKPLF